MTILVVTLNGTPADGGSLYGAPDDTVTTVADTFLDSLNTTTNYGSNTTLSVADEFGGIQRALLKFDLSSLSGATITSAHLQIYQTSGAAETDPLHCYGMLRAWTVGTATWATTDGSTAWGTAGANNTSTDVDATAQDSELVASNGVWRNFDVSSWVQAVANGSRTDYGLLLGYPNQDDSSGYITVTSSDGTDGQRPELWIEYTEGAGGSSALPLLNAYYS